MDNKKYNWIRSTSRSEYAEKFQVCATKFSIASGGVNDGHRHYISQRQPNIFGKLHNPTIQRLACFLFAFIFIAEGIFVYHADLRCNILTLVIITVQLVFTCAVSRYV